MIRITKEFKFEMAHALHAYDGLCKNIHGHSYRLWVTVKGDVKNEKGHTKDGMVMDLHRTLQSRVRLIRSFVREGVTSRGVRRQRVLYSRRG